MTLALLLTAVTGAWATDYYVVGNFTDWSANPAYKMTLNTECTSTTEYMLTLDLPANAQFKVAKDEGGVLSTWYPDGMGNAYGENGELSGAGKYTVYFRPNVDGNPDWFYSVMYVAAATPGTVTLNDTKTIASFEMPTSDVDFNYELVRDMSVDMAVTVQDAQQNSRFRVQKQEQGNSFVPVGLTYEQIVALFTVHDNIEEKNLTANTDYTVQLFAVNEEGQKTGEAIPFNDFTFAPGNYVATAVAATGSAYEGETALSNTFTLFQGYEVTVPAGEYATYYKDEALYVEDEDAKLYTITTVGNETATATELTVAAANTPLLVKNNAAEAKTILLIPTTTATPDNVEVYSGFKGTLEGTQIAGSTDTQANYVCTGKQFTWVKDAGTIAANRCWLELVSSTGAPVLDIVFDGNATGIETTKFTDDANDVWYDLNGRRLQAKPTTKGVYILNGRKVVVK